MNDRGLTLIEVLLVLLVTAALALVAARSHTAALHAAGDLRNRFKRACSRVWWPGPREASPQCSGESVGGRHTQRCRLGNEDNGHEQILFLD